MNEQSNQTKNNTQHLQIPGSVSEMRTTEDCRGVGTQTSLSVNDTGLKESNKNLVQQVFHPGLFVSRPRSASLSSRDANIQTRTLTSTLDTSTPDMTGGNMDHKDLNHPSWQRVPTIRNAKRKKVSSPSPERVRVSNRFSALTIDQTEDEQSETQKRVTKPPPIILYGIEDINKLTELLEKAANKTDFIYKIINHNQLRISCISVEVYKNIINAVREKGLIGHTFNRKDKRSCRIVIRNLHPTTSISDIKEALERTGNTVVGEIINVKFGPKKKPTSTFFANLEQGPNNKAVKNLKHINNHTVIIEDPKKRNTIVQCQRCQQYGHTKNYCMRPYRCVKCAQSHRTAECPKTDRNTPATCALCFGAHPANYKGCEVYREIITRKSKKQTYNKTGETPKTITNSNTEPPPKSNANNNNNNRQRYSDVLKSDKNNLDMNNQQYDITIEEILFKQAEKFDLILQQMSTLMGLIAKLVDCLTK